MATADLSDALSMIRLFMGYIPTRVIYVAAKLGVIDQIGDEGAEAQDLARRLEVHPDALFRVLRALAGLGVLHQDENDRFFVTSFGETLGKDSPQSVRDYAIYSHEMVYEGFERIMDSVRTGTPVIADMFELLRANPDQEATFHAGMGNRGRIETATILDAYDFSRCGRIVDVGGGNGAFLSGILASCEQASGVLYDQQSAIDTATRGRGGALPRCELVAGDFFKSIPLEGDTYVLKRVLFDWADNDVIQILKNCRQAMKDKARLLIIEPFIGPPNEQTPAYLYDMTFLVMLTGRVRTVKEHTDLLAQSDFRVQRVVPTDSDVSVLEAIAV